MAEAVSKLEALLRLVHAVGRTGVRQGTTAVEILLLIAEGPKTRVQLEKALRLGSTGVPYVWRNYFPRVDRKTGVVTQPALPLLRRARMKPPHYRVFIYILSVHGWKLLHQCGILRRR